MRAHHLQHVPFEGLGSIEPWLKSAGHELRTTRMFEQEPLPELDEFDWLIVMGGPMSVNDEAELPWLRAEKQLIRRAIDAGKRVLGVCLGSQLIATALGAKVFPNAHREIGWFEIERTAAAADHPIGRLLPDRACVFHWHGETFELPAGATLLASSRGCKHQIYSMGDRVVALQCHLEMTPPLATALTVHCANELGPNLYVQTPEQMLAHPERFAATNRLMDQILQALSGA